jgi:hypothetical protein
MQKLVLLLSILSHLSCL